MRITSKDNEDNIEKPDSQNLRLVPINNVKDNSSYLQEKINVVEKTFMDMVERGRELEPVPSEIISKIIDAIISIQNIDQRKINQRTLEMFSSLGRQLSIELEEYSRKISLEDDFEWFYGQGEVTITKPKIFTEDFLLDEKIRDDARWSIELQRRMNSLENTYSAEARAEICPKFEELKKLLKLNTKANIWNEVLTELSSNKANKFQSEQFMSKVLVISNEIYLKLKVRSDISESVQEELYEKYANYRKEIYNEDNIKFLNNETIVADAPKISQSLFKIEDKDGEATSNDDDDDDDDDDNLSLGLDLTEKLRDLFQRNMLQISKIETDILATPKLVLSAYETMSEINNKFSKSSLNSKTVAAKAPKISKRLFKPEDKGGEARLFKLVDYLKVLMKQFALFRNTLYSYPLGTCLTLKPSYIDYVSLIAPLWPNNWMLTSYLYHKQQRMPFKITLEQIKSQIELSPKKDDGLLSIFYIHSQSKDKIFFFEPKTAQDILSLVLDVCEDNFENMQYLNLDDEQHLLENMRYQFYLSVLGQCVSLMCLAYLVNEEYVLKELKVKMCY